MCYQHLLHYKLLKSVGLNLPQKCSTVTKKVRCELVMPHFKCHLSHELARWFLASSLCSLPHLQYEGYVVFDY